MARERARDGTVLAHQETMVRLREVTLFLLFFVWTWCTAPAIAGGAETPDKSKLVPQSTQATPSSVISVADASSLSHDGELLTDLPPNLRVPRDLRQVLEQALRRSPTLQRQMQTLLHTQRVRMSVSYGGLRGMRLFQARSIVRHHQWGALVVDTTLFAPADMVELFAHEMEHVCEQIEGVDLRALAGSRDSGVYDIGGHFETQRAINAGHRVAREMLGLPVSTTN
jgi:hypothetical protein